MALKTITIDDFSGGRKNYVDQTLIPNNSCSSGSYNVWAPDGALSKMSGWTIQSTVTSTANMGVYFLFYDTSVTTAFSLYSILSTDGSKGYAYASLGISSSPKALGYSAGTLSISGATLISATGNGTSWLTNSTGGDGDRIVIPSDSNTWRRIASVEDNTHLTLTDAAAAAVPTGSAYTIGQNYTNVGAQSVASLNGIISICSSGDLITQYNGTNVTRLSPGYQPAYLATHKNYMFFARTASNPSRIGWTTIKDPTTFPANNFIDIDVKNDYISGLFSVGPELIIFKNRGLYKLLGDVFDPSNPQYYVVRISTPPGFLHNEPWGMTMHNGRMLFVAWDKIYSYIPGTTFITDISMEISRDMNTAYAAFSTSIGKAAIHAYSYSGYAFFGKWTMSGITTPVVLMLDRKNAWWLINDTPSGIFSASYWTVIPQTSAQPLLAMPTVNAYVSSTDLIGPGFSTNFLNGAGNTSAISAQWISKNFNIDYGTFKWVIIFLKKQSAGNLTVQWSIDQGTSVSNTVDMTVGRGQIIRAVLPVNQKGSTIQLTLSNAVASQTFNIYAIKIVYEESVFERLL